MTTPRPQRNWRVRTRYRELPDNSCNHCEGRQPAGDDHARKTARCDTSPAGPPASLCCPAGALPGQNPPGNQREPVDGVDRGLPAGHRAGGEG